jgi:mannose-6-phosphate isomerase-like protein (cupin superfamily)
MGRCLEIPKGNKMKVVHKNQTKEFKNSEACTALEYPLGDRDINGAVVELNGRYPGKGRVVNLKCKELAYVVKGSGKLVVEGKELVLQEGDLALIEPGEKYFWEGNMTMFMPCTPAWYPEQHKEVK